MGDIKQQIKSLISEAEIYKSQGLADEARAKYEAAAKLISSIPNIKNRDTLLRSIKLKVGELRQDQNQSGKDLNAAKLSPTAQNLIKNLIVSSGGEDDDDVALQGAIVLAKLGQFDSALEEFNRLITKDSVRVAAAKNILQCHLARSSEKAAIEQYRQWMEDDEFPPKQLDTVRQYLEEILQQRGVQSNLPSPQSERELEIVGELEPIEENADDDFIDITSIAVTFENGPNKGKTAEFDVNFQSGSMLSLIISKNDADLLNGLEKGTELNEIQFFSPIAIFSGSGVVISKTQIRTGPKQGDYCLDIRIVST